MIEVENLSKRFELGVLLEAKAVNPADQHATICRRSLGRTASAGGASTG